MPDEVTRRLRRSLLIGQSPLEATEDPFAGLCLLICLRVVSIDAQASLFVDVGVADRDQDRVSGDVHHHYIEEQETNTETGYGYHVESATTNGEGLEETVKNTSAGG